MYLDIVSWMSKRLISLIAHLIRVSERKKKLIYFSVKSD